MARHWVGTWSATPAPADGVALDNPTIRMFPRVSIGGDTIRVRLSNAAGTADLTIASTHIAKRGAGASIRLDTDRAVTFNGLASVKIGAGAFALSDPVSLPVAPLEDLAVSIHLPGIIPASFGVTGRYARQFNYLSPPGDFTTMENMFAARVTDDWFFLSGIDVLAPHEVGGIVALGDSITDGNISTHDAICRWPDQLATAPDRARRQDVRRDEPGPRRQPQLSWHAWRQRSPPLRPGRARAARRDPRDRYSGRQRPTQPSRPA